MIDIRNFDLFLSYYNEARKIMSPQWQENREIYLDPATFNTGKNHSEDKIICETSFSPYSGMKIHI